MFFPYCLFYLRCCGNNIASSIYEGTDSVKSKYYYECNPTCQKDAKSFKLLVSDDIPPEQFFDEKCKLLVFNNTMFKIKYKPDKNIIIPDIIPYNGYYLPLRSIIRVMPFDTLIYNVVKSSNNRLMDAKLLIRRIVFSPKYLKDDKYEDFLDERTHAANIKHGVIIFSGKFLSFVTNSGVTRIYNVYFCEYCGFYIHVWNGILYLNVQVNNVIYLYLLTTLFAYLKVIDNKNWPLLACKTTEIPYVKRLKDQDKSWCRAKHPFARYTFDVFVKEGYATACNGYKYLMKKYDAFWYNYLSRFY